MFGMGGLNPKNMEKMMKQLGMNTTTIEADEVVIKAKGKDIVITNPSIQKISIQGQESFQISGTVEEKAAISEDDVKLVAEKTGRSEKEARKALEETNDIAEAIMLLEKQ